jgi:hypothetical protein
VIHLAGMAERQTRSTQNALSYGRVGSNPTSGTKKRAVDTHRSFLLERFSV